MNIDTKANTVDGQPAMEPVEHEHAAQIAILAAIAGMSIDSAQRCCAWALSRLKQEREVGAALTALDAINKLRRADLDDDDPRGRPQ